jgi:hypothetical protein
MNSLNSLFEWYFTPIIIKLYLAACLIYMYIIYNYINKYNISYNSQIVTRCTFYKFIFVGWNLLASIFSLFCFMNVIEDTSKELIINGVQSHICDAYVPFRYSMYGIFLYVITKPLEFVDTFLLMLYKKPIIFLHWYHHVLTVLSVLFIAINKIHHSSMGLWFGINNLFVHTIMYLYYAFTAFKNPINGFLRKTSFLITILQTLQMFIGIWIVYQSTKCNNALNNKYEIMLYGGMYLSYIFLFTNLLLKKLDILDTVKDFIKQTVSLSLEFVEQTLVQ